MNRTALVTVGKKLTGNDLYLLSVFDLEPSGIIIQAYNQIDSKEYMLPISEQEMAKAGVTRNINSLNILLDSMKLVPQGDSFVLESSIDHIPTIKAKTTSANLAEMLNEPLVPGQKSLNEVLVAGLVELCKVKPVGSEAVTWLGHWLLDNSPNKPRVDDPVA